MQRLNRIHLNGLRAVECVGRTGSLTAAARELGVSASAVSQQINRTERQLGRIIFERTARGLAPTAFGAALIARLTLGFRTLDDAVALADDGRENVLIVSVAPAFASKWLVPRLSRHFARHPDVLVRIDASGHLADLHHSDVDVAIRMGTGQWPGVKAELLLAQDIFPVCTPAMARDLRTVADLARATAIDDEGSMFTWERWFAAAGVAPVPLLPGARFNDPILCLDTVIAGQGVMLAWQLLAAEALADGRLVAPFGFAAESGLGYWLCTAESAPTRRKVTNFKAWLREELAASAPGFGSMPAKPPAKPPSGLERAVAAD